jgi:hypothetical protein
MSKTRKFYSISTTLVILLLSFSSTQATRINPERDLTYMGAFRMGTGVYQPGMGLSFYSDGNSRAGSLFVIKEAYAEGNPNTNWVYEITIPIPKIGAIETLNSASVLNHGDITGGKLSALQTSVSKYYCMGDVQPYNGKLHWNVFVDYDIGTYYYNSQGWSDISFFNPNAKGVWKVGPDKDVGVIEGYCGGEVCEGRYHGDYLALADKEWADTYIGSKYLLEGRRRTNGTKGPALYAIAPWSEGNSTADKALIGYAPLLRYGPEHPIPGDASLDTYRDVVWIKSGNNRALLFVGIKGNAANDCYGTSCYDPCAQGVQAFHAYPYTNQFRWYDPADLAAVYSGEKKAWEPVPYSTSTPNVFYAQSVCPGNRGEIGGAAFDPSNSLLYVSEIGVDGNDSVVHVWKVGGESSNSIATPSNLRIK